MNICSDEHDEIVYEGDGRCPICVDILALRSDLKAQEDENEQLEKENDELKAKIEELI